MRIAARTKSITVVVELPVPFLPHNLRHGLLDQPVKNGGDAQIAFASIRFGDFHTQDGFGAVGAFCKLLAYLGPVLFKKSGKVINGHTINARCSFIALNLF